MTTSSLQRYVYVLLALVLTVVVLYFGRNLLFLIIFPAILSFLVLPLAQRMERWGMPRWASATLNTLLVLVVVGGVFGTLGSRFISFKDEIPVLQERLDHKLDMLLEAVEQRFDVSTREQLTWLDTQLRSMSELGGKLAVDMFAWTGTVLSNVILVVIFLLLMLLYRDRFRTFFERLSKERSVPIMKIVSDISELSRKYLKGVALVILILACLNSVGFAIIGLKYPILLGFTSALLTIIPYVGTMIGGLLPLAVAFLTKDSLMYPLAVLGVVALSQFLEGNFITPKVVGSSVSLNPLASMLALVAGGMLWGIAGMILAIPLMGMFKVVCDAVPGMQPYGYLLGEESERGWRRKKALRKV